MCRLIKCFRLKVCEKDLDALNGRTMDLMSALRYCEGETQHIESWKIMRQPGTFTIQGLTIVIDGRFEQRFGEALKLGSTWNQTQ